MSPYCIKVAERSLRCSPRPHCVCGNRSDTGETATYWKCLHNVGLCAVFQWTCLRSERSVLEGTPRTLSALRMARTNTMKKNASPFSTALSLFSTRSASEVRLITDQTDDIIINDVKFTCEVFFGQVLAFYLSDYFLFLVNDDFILVLLVHLLQQTHSWVLQPRFTVDSVTEAQKWLTGLELLWRETLEAPTPVLIERYTQIHAYSGMWGKDTDLFTVSTVGWGSRCTLSTRPRPTGMAGPSHNTDFDISTFLLKENKTRKSVNVRSTVLSRSASHWRSWRLCFLCSTTRPSALVHSKTNFR